MKKITVGDSVKFKDGRTGIVEEYDDKYYYIRDNNTNIVKIKKSKKVKDSLIHLNSKNTELVRDGIVNLGSREGMNTFKAQVMAWELRNILDSKGFKSEGVAKHEDGYIMQINTDESSKIEVFVFCKPMDYNGMDIFYIEPYYYEKGSDKRVGPTSNNAFGIELNADKEAQAKDLNEASDTIIKFYNELVD